MPRRRDLLFRAMRLQCPPCGGGPVFVSWVRMCPSCPSCGMQYDREPQGGYWVGAYTINLFVTEAIFGLSFLVLLLVTWPTPPWDQMLWAGVLLNILVPILFFPFSKTLFVAVDLIVRPQEPRDFEKPIERARVVTRKR